MSGSIADDSDTAITRTWLINFSEQLRRQTQYTLRQWRGVLVLTDTVAGLPQVQAITLHNIKTREQARQLGKLLGMK